MTLNSNDERLGGVWSAAPTPFDDKMRLDLGSVRRMVKHHLRLGVNGLFLAGSNGEGPFMTDRDCWQLVEAVAKCANGELLIAVQVTDNSATRILANISSARDAGADIAVLAPPYLKRGPYPDAGRTCLEAVDRSDLPVGIYDQGRHATFPLPDSLMRKLYMRDNVVLAKDSSGDPKRRALALACRRKRPGLHLLNGNEFDCVSYLEAGYDGLLLGGGIFNGYMAHRIFDAVRQGDLDAARRMQARMSRIMFSVYGGKSIKCWLSGEKKLLKEMGIFRTWRNHLDYPLTPSCIRAIDRVLQNDMDVLMPWRKGTK